MWISVVNKKSLSCLCRVAPKPSLTVSGRKALLASVHAGAGRHLRELDLALELEVGATIVRYRWAKLAGLVITACVGLKPVLHSRCL
jgi:hypothetical protein